MTWIEGIHCERSVRGAHECPISVFTGAVGDDLSTRDRRSAGVLNQAMHPSLHLTGSANGEPKDQGNHPDRSRANEGERDQCRFSHCGHLPKWFRLVCRILRKEVPKGVPESPPFLAGERGVVSSCRKLPCLHVGGKDSRSRRRLPKGINCNAED